MNSEKSAKQKANVPDSGGRKNEQQATDKPAIGIRIDSTTSTDHLAGALLRLIGAEYDVFVASNMKPSTELASFTSQLGIHTFWIGETAGETVAKTAVAFARDAGYPGIVWHTDLTELIDLEASMQTLTSTDSYTVEASYKPTVSESRLLVGIPAYNEAQAIADVINSAQLHADEVLVVDDGSDDKTVERATEAGATVIEHRTNKGYGGALKTIFEEASRANTDLLVIIDADGQHNPDEIPSLVEAQQANDADIIIGSRFVDDGDTDAPLYRRFGLSVVNLLTNLSLGVVRSESRIKDTQSGFRLYSQSAIDSLSEAEDIGDQMSASTDILYHAHHNEFDIEEVGAEVKYEVEDANNVNPIAHGITLVMNIIRTVEQDRPVTILGIPGFLSTLVGIGFGYWTLSKYIAFGTFPMGLAISSVFFGLAGIFAAFTAIILHSLNTHLK